MKPIRTAICLALSLLYAGAASADAHITLSVHSLSYTLVDLNPDDGITPWVTFQDYGGATWSNTMRDRNFYDFDFENIYETRDFAASKTSQSMDISISGAFGNTPAEVEGRITVDLDKAPGSYPTFSTYVRGHIPFIMSPASAIFFTAHLQGEVSFDGSAATWLEEFTYGGRLNATGGVGSYPSITIRNGFTPDTSSIDLFLFASNINTGNTDEYATVAYGTEIAGKASNAIMGPVPEPNTVWMLAAGGLLLGALGRVCRR